MIMRQNPMLFIVIPESFSNGTVGKTKEISDFILKKKKAK